MARPKCIEGEKTAEERMKDAFWSMLGEMPYYEMTCKELRGRAGVSHNTFYYHYKSMDDMARKLFDELDIGQGPSTILAVLAHGGVASDVVDLIPDFATRYLKVRLIAGSGSPMLVEMLRASVVKAWLEAVGLSESDLTQADRIDLDYAFGGGIAMLGNSALSDFTEFVSFAEREIGAGVLSKLQSLAQRGRKPQPRPPGSLQAPASP